MHELQQPDRRGSRTAGSAAFTPLALRRPRRALQLVFERGRTGDQYNIGGCNESTNLELVRTLCTELDELAPDKNSGPRQQRITFAEDRKGHDRRYTIHASKMADELNWQPRETLQTGLRRTIRWHLDNRDWTETIRNAGYDGQRQGLGLGLGLAAAGAGAPH